MRIDVYTKLLLALIAALMLFHEIKPLLLPISAEAQYYPDYGKLQVSGAGQELWVYDSAKGVVTKYQISDDYSHATPIGHGLSMRNLGSLLLP